MKKLSTTVSFALQTAISIVLAFASKIKNEASRLIITSTLRKANDVVKALSDSDPDDDRQMLAIANSLVTDEDFFSGSNIALKGVIDKAPEPFRSIIQQMKNKVYDVAALMTDPNPNNGDQIKFLLTSWLHSPEGVSFLQSLVDIALPEEEALYFGAILAQALQGFIPEMNEELLQIRDKRVDSLMAGSFAPEPITVESTVKMWNPPFKTN